MKIYERNMGTEGGGKIKGAMGAEATLILTYRKIPG